MAESPQYPLQIMENQTRFDLNAAIENWQNELGAQPHFSADDCRELEAHLRDLISEFQRKGLSDEESFWLASKRIGQPQKLAAEFVKENPTQIWRERVFWMAFGIMVFWRGTLIISYLENIVLFHLSSNLRQFYRDYWGLLGSLPILFAGILLAKNWLISKINWCLQSRLRLILLVFLLNFLCNLTQMGSIHEDGFDANYHITWSVWLRGFFQHLLSYLQFSIAPLVFILWFFPKQNRKPLKRA